MRAQPVRVFVLGSEEWREFEDWPPPASQERSWWLQPDGGLGSEAPRQSSPDTYRYDPADPTPAVGGNMLLFGAGPKDNRELEGRSDVLTFTTEPLESEITVVGTPVVNLYVSSSATSADFFVRLCDVAPDGRSVNICDGITRVSPIEDVVALELRLTPTACSFEAGHRLRLQISSGAHPRFARNLGTDEPLATATTIEVAHQSIFHDPAHPSSLTLRCL